MSHDRVTATDGNVIHVDFRGTSAMIEHTAPDWAVEYNLEWLYESAQRAKKRQEILRATRLADSYHAEGVRPEGQS